MGVKHRRLLRLGGEFRQLRLEQLFRQSQSAAEWEQVLRLWCLALLGFVIYGCLDGAGQLALRQSWHAADDVPRVLIVLTGLVALFLYPRANSPAQRDLISFVALLLIATCYGQLLQQRASPGNPIGATVLLIIGCYLFSPGRYLLTCINGALFLLAVGVALWRLGGLEAGGTVAFSYLLLANLLAATALAQWNRIRRLAYLRRSRLRREVQRRRAAQAKLEIANREISRLLYSAIPEDIAEELRRHPGRKVARHCAQATVIFADITGFTPLARRLQPIQLLEFLEDLLGSFDELARHHGVEKIKNIGDAWMGVAGVGAGYAGSQAENALSLASAQQRVFQRVCASYRLSLQLRIGVHSGPLLEGVIGRHRPAYDIWGETVNIASRLQAAARPGTILASEITRGLCPVSAKFGTSRRLALRGCAPLAASEYSDSELVQ
jgi:class 3 adenylate cyclase